MAQVNYTCSFYIISNYILFIYFVSSYIQYLKISVYQNSHLWFARIHFVLLFFFLSSPLFRKSYSKLVVLSNMCLACGHVEIIFLFSLKPF